MKNIIYLMFSLSLLLSSCKSDLLDTYPYDKFPAEKMWKTVDLANQGVTGIYSHFRGVGYGYFMSFEDYGITSHGRDNTTLLRGTIETGNGLFSGYWKDHFEGVHRSNDAIKNLPNTPLQDKDKARLIAEAKFLRAFFYFRLNVLFKGVPYYDEVLLPEEFVKERESEDKIWEYVIADLTDCINEANLPDKYKKGDALFGRITKSTAYALRGKVYMYQKKWAEAEVDFKKVGELGHSLFQGGYKELFKEANEQSDEMILSVQCIGLPGKGHELTKRYGSRVAFQQGWNSFLPSTDFVDTYECADGKKFDWNDFIPGYNEMDPKARAVYFMRDNMDKNQIEAAAKAGADMSKYLPTANEARVKAAYANRDPRLALSVITPYSEFLGASNGETYNYTSRWPYAAKSDVEAPFDLRTDTRNRFFYLHRKFVAEGASEIPDRHYSPVDLPIIRYADVVLSLAEALNEQGKTAEAIEEVNKVRARAEAQLLNSNEFTQVADQNDLRERIRNERRWEFIGEGVNFLDEMRWKTWGENKFQSNKAGLKQIWGQVLHTFTWGGDKLYAWPVPKKEKEMNLSLTQNPGWVD